MKVHPLLTTDKQSLAKGDVGNIFEADRAGWCRANGDRTPEAGAPGKLNNIQRPKSRTGKAARPKGKSVPSGKGDLENMPATLAGVPFEDMTEEQQKQYLALKASGKKWLGTKNAASPCSCFLNIFCVLHASEPCIM
jgi:hypothetical protein